MASPSHIGLARAEAPLAAKVQRLIASAGLNRAAVGVSVIEVHSGRILCGIGETRPMTPASNLKLITTGAALVLLGEDFQFTTSVYAEGPVDAQGILNGNLVVMAGGDPCIGGRGRGGKAAVFDAWAARIARTVSAVRGDLVIDGTVFDRQTIHPSWPKDQLGRWYCAPVSAFALRQNCVDVQVRPGARPGETPHVAFDPPTRYFKVDNRCTTVASGRARAYVSRLPASDTIVVTGKLTPQSAGAGSPIAVKHPALYAATVLRERLARAGVRISGRLVRAERRSDTRRMTRLAATSHPLLDAVRAANKRSHNFYAEMILKTLGRSVSVPASFADGVRAIEKLLRSLGIKPGTFTIEDGSGLSRKNAVSALQFTCFLRYMAKAKSAKAFIGSLPASGVDGTLRGRMARPPYKGKVRAKTGHVRGVSALSGYVDTGGKLLAFSILVNGKGLRSHAADGLQDAICRLLVDSAP